MPEDVATAAPLAERYVLLDLETTGAHPERDRITEIALLRFEGGRLVDRWQSLVRPDVPIPPLIERLVGITNAMVADAPPAAEVMAQARRFVGDTPLVAHNAPFDRGFWHTELARAGCDAPQPFACTVRLARRLYPEAPNHQLGTLARFHQLPSAGRAHRALEVDLRGTHGPRREAGGRNVLDAL